MSAKKSTKKANEEIQNIAPEGKNATPAKIPVGVIKLRDKKQIQAAQLIIDGGLTDHQIAEKLGIGKGTIAKWKVKPEFAAYLNELKNVFRERFLKEGLALKENRVAMLSNLANRQMKVITDREAEAAKPDSNLKNVAGASTGLVTMTVRGLSKTPVEEVDNQTTKTLCSILDQISIEVGDKNLKSEVKINDAIGERIERAQARAKRVLEQQAQTQGSTAIN